MLHTDFTLTVVEDAIGEAEAKKTKAFHLHRFVLSARSPWFAEKFETGEWKQLGQAEVQCGDNGIFTSVSQASALFDFLYATKIDVSESDASNLADALETLRFEVVANAIRKELNNKERELHFIVLKPEKERARLTQELGTAYAYSFGSELDVEPQMGNKNAWHDICLTVVDENDVAHRYACHRALLCQHSAYFNAMITGRFSEANMLRQSQNALPVIQLDGISNPTLFNIAVHFLYTNALKGELNSEDTIELLLLCDKLMLMELKRLCAVRLRKSLDSTNAFRYLRLGDTFNVSLLRIAALDYIESHIAELHTTKEYADALLDLPLDIVHELKLYVQDKLQKED